MASTSTARPYQAGLTTLFILLSAIGLWFMRIHIAINEAPVGFIQSLEKGVFPNGHVIKKDFTGFKPVDEVLALLVSAFIYAPTGWNEVFYWQQIHFLLQFTAMIAIMNIEACRERNRGSWLKYTAVCSFLYQNIGGAVILPIWWMMFHRVSGRTSYFASGRKVPLPYASVILPGTLLLFLIPTIAIYIPGTDIITLQNILAFWQWTPVLVNLPLWIASPFVSSTPAAASKKTRESDLVHLRAIYAVIFATSLASHWFTLAGVLTSADPAVSLSTVFLPNPATWLTTADYGLLWLFQWDWIICGSLQPIAAWVAVLDMQRQLNGSASIASMTIGTIIIALLTVLGGPGAVLAAVWMWREDRMAAIEDRPTSVKKKL